MNGTPEFTDTTLSDLPVPRLRRTISVRRTRGWKPGAGAARWAFGELLSLLEQGARPRGVRAVRFVPLPVAQEVDRFPVEVARAELGLGVPALQVHRGEVPVVRLRGQDGIQLLAERREIGLETRSALRPATRKKRSTQLIFSDLH